MSTLTSHLVTRNPDAAAAWYAAVLGAEETSRITLPGGQVMTIELRFGDSTLAIADEFPGMGVVSPLTLGGTYGALHLAGDQHLRDVPHDEVVRLAAAAMAGQEADGD
jgi:PhnB protein